MEYSNRDISSAILFLVFVIYAVYRLRTRKLSLIDIKTDHLVLNRLLLGEFVIYSEDIINVTINSNEKIILKTANKKYTIDQYVDKENIIKFCTKNKISILRESQ